MANNRVEIDITANDRATAVVSNLNRNLLQLGSSGNMVQVVLGNMASGGLVAGLSAVAGTIGAVVLGFQAVSSALSGVMSGIREASTLQTSFLTAANSTGLNLKISLPEAEEIQKKLGTSISLAAATQPGSTQDYLTIANVISGSIARAYQGKPKEFLDASTELVKGAGLLSLAANVDPASAGTTIGRFVNGTSSFSQLRLIDFFEKNPDLVEKIDAVAKERGLETEKLEAWTQKQRVDVFNAAIGQIVTPEFLARLNNTAEAKLQIAQAAMFDPQTGLFGFMREVKGLGGLSALDSFNNLLTTVLGVSETGSKLAKALGITIDPMYVLGTGINIFNDILVKVGGWLGSLDPDKLKITGSLGGIGNGVTEWLNKGISSLLKSVENFDGVAFGGWLANITNVLMRNISSFLINFEWWKALQTILTLPVKIGDILYGYVTSIDYGSFFAFFDGMMLALFKNIGKFIGYNFSLAMGSIFNVLASVGGNLLEMWDGFMNMLKTGITGSMLTLLGTGVTFIKTELEKKKDQIFSALSSVASNLMSMWDNFISKLKNGFNSLLDRIKSFIPDLPNVGNAVSSTVQNFVDPIKSAGSAVLDTGKSGLDSATKLLTPKPEAKPVSYAPSVTVNAPPGTDGQSIAQMVISKIEEQYNSFRSSALA